MDRIVVVESPLPQASRCALALQNPFSQVFAGCQQRFAFEEARWKALHQFLSIPTSENFHVNSIYSWSLGEIKRIEDWVKMLKRVISAKNSAFTTGAAKVFSTRLTPIWLRRPEILFDEE